MAASTTLPSPRSFITDLVNSLAALPPSSANAPLNGASAPPNPLDVVPESAKKQLLTLHVVFPNELLPALDLLDRRLVTRFRIQDEIIEAHGDSAEQTVTGNKDSVKVASAGENTVATVTRILQGNAGKEKLTSESPIEVPSHSPIHSHATFEGASTSLVAEQALSAAAVQPPPDRTVFYVRSAQTKHSRFSTSYESTTHYEVRLTAWNCSCPAFAFSAFPSTSSDDPVDAAFPPQDLSWMADTALPGGNDGASGTSDWVFGGVSLGESVPPVCKHLLACVLVERCSSVFGAFVEEKDVSVEEAAAWAAGWGD